jgi:hypothetical protein
MQIGGEGIENMALGKETWQWHIFQKTPFHASLLDSNLELSKWWLWFLELKVVITKPSLINHCHYNVLTI